MWQSSSEAEGFVRELQADKTNNTNMGHLSPIPGTVYSWSVNGETLICQDPEIVRQSDLEKSVLGPPSTAQDHASRHACMGGTLILSKVFHVQQPARQPNLLVVSRESGNMVPAI